MKTCDVILAVLEEKRGSFVSGEELAAESGVSRNGVWKNIKVLCESGHKITAVTGKGYRLDKDSPVMSLFTVKKHLSNECELTVLESCPSTNTYAKEAGEKGAPHGTVVIANEQTGGRGRMGRRFFSPKSTGLYMSILLRPGLATEESLEITTAAAVALVRVIKRYTKRDVRIKWVNDIYIDMKKVSGILTEASLDVESGKLNFAVLGIGVNLFAPCEGFPREIENIAASVLDVPYSAEVKARFAAEVIDEFMCLYKKIGSGVLVDEYRENSFICNKKINVLKGDSVVPAEALEILDDYSLKVQLESGETCVLNSGDVSIRFE